MANKKIVFVNQVMAPYLSGSESATRARDLALGLHKRKYEVRTFMPKFGDVNERRNQLHEVIRLSGINIPIADADHPLIIKVASLQPARIQVYFIDNDDYFQKEDSDVDPAGSNRSDNDERSIFFARGTAETICKLKWNPDIIHCSGWVSALTPILLRNAYSHEAAYKGAKIVYSVQDPAFAGEIDPAIWQKLADENIPAEVIETLKSLPLDANLLHRIAISHADAVVFETAIPDPELLAMVEERGLPYMTVDAMATPETFDEFYAKL